MSETCSLTPSLTGLLALSAIYALCLDRFGRPFRFCQLEFDKEAISDGCKSENARWRGLNFKWFRELSFCGHCGSCLSIYCVILKIIDLSKKKELFWNKGFKSIRLFKINGLKYANCHIFSEDTMCLQKYIEILFYLF